MNYAECEEYLEEISKYGSVLGLDNIRTLLKKLGDPQNSLRFVQVAGTNGKGSVCAFTESVLRRSGYAVGLYTSPAVFSHLETIKLGKSITKADYADVITRVAEKADAMEHHPTVFEIETAAAILYFFEKKADVVILECGLGGRDDATNVVDTTILSVITSISKDHTHILGPDEGSIARVKAGIIKNGATVVSAMQDEEALEVIKKAAEKAGSSLVVCDEDKDTKILSLKPGRNVFNARALGKTYEKLVIGLNGLCQFGNALVALNALLKLKELGFDLITEKTVRAGFSSARHPGRFEVIADSPVTVIDGAHNPDAALLLRESVELYFKNKRLIFIMGVFADKDYDSILRIMAPLAEHIITVHTPGNDRALPSYELAKAALLYNPNVTSAASLQEAVELARLLADKKDVILIFGSLSFLKNIKALVKKDERIR